MACNCSKRKQPTGFGLTLPRPAADAPDAPDKPAEVYRLQKSDGTIMEFGSKMEAHAERLRSGNGKFI